MAVEISGTGLSAVYVVPIGGGSSDLVLQARGDVLDDLNTLGANTAANQVAVGTAAGVLAWQSNQTARETLGVVFKATRAELVTWWAANSARVEDGTTMFGGAFAFQASAASTDISDMAGVVPFGNVYPDHFTSNATPGTTDMEPAITAALLYSKKVFLRGTVYKCNNEVALTRNGHWLVGISREHSVIEFTSGVDIGTSAITMRRRCRLTSMTVRYADGVVTGGEIEGQRVLVELNNVDFSVTKGAVPVSDVAFGDCGTAVYSDPAATPFNYSIRDVFIGAFSYRGIDVSLGTGASLDNIYIEGGLVYTCKNVINIRPPTGNDHISSANIGQINIHQVRCSENMINIDRVDTLIIASLHTEATELAGNDTAFMFANRSNVVIGNWKFLHSAIQGDDCSLMLLEDGGMLGGGSEDAIDRSRIVIENLVVRGVNNPNDALFDVPTPYVPGVDVTTGWKWARRVVKVPAVVGEYQVTLGDTPHLIYGGDVSAAEQEIYRGFASNSDPDVTIIHKDARKNFITNSGMDTWVRNTSSTNGEEVATGWTIIETGGTLTVSRELAAWHGQLTPFLNANNIGTEGNAQEIRFTGFNPWELTDQSLVLSFVGVAATAGRHFYDATMVVDDNNAATSFARIEYGDATEFAFDTTPKRHSITFDAPTATGLTWGAAPFFTIRFRLVNGANSFPGDFSISKVKLEIGKMATLSPDLA